jgi:ankyrin repeat protein
MARKMWLCGWLALAVLVGRVTAYSADLTLPSPQSYRDATAVALRSAIKSGKLETVRELVNAAATNDCLELDEQGRTALQYAVRQCTDDTANASSFEILKLLASRSNCVNVPDRFGREPILDLEPLSWTSRARMDALHVLIAAGADINARDENGATILHQLLSTWDASAMYLPEVLNVVLAAKAQPNIVDSAGQSPLHYLFGPRGFCSDREGSRATKVAIAQKVFTNLMSAGADITLKDHDGTTPLGSLLMQYETFFGTKEFVLTYVSPALAKLLNVNAAHVKDRPALIYLCDKGQSDPALVNRLIELGADPKMTEDDGFTALHGAAWFYNAVVCEVLIQRGADVNAVNDKGRTPLHELARSKYFDSAFLESDRYASILMTADVLVAHGVNRHLKDKEGKTALDLFKASGGGSTAEPELLRAVRKKLRP